MQKLEKNINLETPLIWSNVGDTQIFWGYLENSIFNIFMGD